MGCAVDESATIRCNQQSQRLVDSSLSEAGIMNAIYCESEHQHDGRDIMHVFSYLHRVPIPTESEQYHTHMYQVRSEPGAAKYPIYSFSRMHPQLLTVCATITATHIIFCARGILHLSSTTILIPILSSTT
jgi:hypothetical protein